MPHRLLQAVSVECVPSARGARAGLLFWWVFCDFTRGLEPSNCDQVLICKWCWLMEGWVDRSHFWYCFAFALLGGVGPRLPSPSITEKAEEAWHCQGRQGTTHSRLSNPTRTAANQHQPANQAHPDYNFQNPPEDRTRRRAEVLMKKQPYMKAPQSPDTHATG